MGNAEHLVFGPFRLDPMNKHLWRGNEELGLRPMAVAVLHTLAEHAGQVLSKEDLLKRVWAGTFVTRTALRVCIREIRQALGDNVITPSYIETLGRRGYRFIGNKNTEAPLLAAKNEDLADEPIVGREREVEQLCQSLAKAKQGVRQLVFVTGEPGIGKTTVVELFLAHVRSDADASIGRGQCLEQYSEGEPYLPILDALGCLCQEPGGARLLALLRHYAPTWLVQMPALLSDAELVSLQQKTQGATRQRMLREVAEAIEALTTERLLVLVLEDLHRSDYSTLELISYLAQRPKWARLMVIGTYRPSDIADGHPLKGIHRELQAYGRCQELPLKLLTERNVAEYLAKRLPGNSVPAKLARVVHQRTEGNALFVVNMVQALVNQGLMIATNGRWTLQGRIEPVCVPDTLRQLIEYRFENLGLKEQCILEAASIAGREFTAAVVAAVLRKEPLHIEEVSAELVRHKQFIQAEGISEWPDGTVTARYRFIHALYQEVLYDRVTVGKRVQMHFSVGERLERAHGDRRQEMAAELAMHFEHGRDSHRAVHYLRQAAENASQQCAYLEVGSLLAKAMKLLKTLPDTPERARQELLLQLTLGVSLMATKGYASQEAKTVYEQARKLCQLVSTPPLLIPMLRGLAAFYYVRAELQTARELGEQILGLIRPEHDPALIIEACAEIAGTLFSLGEFAAALNNLERGIHLYEPKNHRSYTVLYGQDPGVSSLSRASHALWLLGYQDQALTRNQEALTLARGLSHPHSLAYALNFAALLHQLRREGQVAQAHTEAAIALSTEQGFPIWVAGATILRGWALAEQGQLQEGIAQIHEGMASWQAIGAEISRPHFLGLLAEAYGRYGQAEKGLTVLAEALVLAQKTGDCWWEAELYRLKGELTLQQFKVHSSKLLMLSDFVVSRGAKK